jgi:hypothetical protein
VRSTIVRGLAAGAALAAAVVISGCGATSTVSQTLDPVARAADVTSKVQGYRIQATTTVGTAAGSVQVAMSGIMNRADRTGQMTARETIAGHALTLNERFSGLTFYMDAAGLPGVSQVTHGKRWLKMDMSRTLGSLGLGSLSTTNSDPSQFVDYLRAVSARTRRIGTETVRGAATTHYHAVVDLSRYPRLVAPSARPAARRGISTLETVLGSHTLAMDVWIGADKLVHRLSFGYPECVNSQKLSFNMTMDLYDYGPQPTTRMPSDGQAYDLTPLVSSAMKNIKFGCASSSA